MVRKLALSACLMLVPAAVGATVVVRASVERLVEVSDVVVHAVVRSVNDATAAPGEPIRTEVGLELLEILKGLPHHQTTLELSLPGGRMGDRTVVVPGMPTFHSGDQVILLLERTGRGYALAGLAQGVYKVEVAPDGALMATRNLRGLATVQSQSGGIDETGLPSETRRGLVPLLEYLRGLCNADETP